jgi:hypothetical protein
MELSISPEFQEFLENNIKNSKTEPEFVYHYTDMDAFLGIIQNNELWLTDRNYMNDVYDESYAKGIFDKYIRTLNSNILSDGATFDDRGYQNIKKSYIFSTSIKKDVANQWLCYGNGAVCIEFRKNELNEFVTKFAAKRPGGLLGFAYKDDFLSSPVFYEEETVEKFKVFLKDKYGNDYAKRLDKNIDSLQEEIYANYHYHAICGFIKQKGFAAEEEYRFLVLSNQAPCFRTKNSRLIPFIKVKLCKEKLPIKTIILGPKNHDELIKNTVEELLKKHHYSFSIEQSSLSLR